jgi:hypothetical protein
MLHSFRPIGLLCSLMLACTLVTLDPHRLQADLLTSAERQTIIHTYDADLAAFKRLRPRLFQLARQVKARSDLFGPKPSGDTSLLRADRRSEILNLWYPIVDIYLALDHLSEKHMQSYQLRQRKDRKRSFLLARAVFLTQYRVALELMAVLEQNPMVDTILNEENAALGLPKGVYAQFKNQYLNVAKAGRFAAVEAVARVYKAPGDAQLAHWAGEDRRIVLAAGKGPGPRMTFKNGMAIVKRLRHRAWFPVQKGVAEWMGHTKVWRPHRYLIRPAQINAIAGRLEPGDILLERREWYMTNVGIPGFWTHVALYIGDADQRTALSGYPDVKKWLHSQGAESVDHLIQRRYPDAHAGLHTKCKDGLLPQVIEAISPGVTFTSLTYSATCDSLAVLRPRLSTADRAAAVVRAMRYYGRPYDYDFDFGSDTSLVCTELVVKSYLPDTTKKGLDLPMVRLMGHMITPANAFVRQFDQTFGSREQQMDLVLFLDGHERDKRATASDVETFRTSWNRPKWHIMVQYAKDLKGGV